MRLWLLLAVAAPLLASDYSNSVIEWRRKHEEALKADGGWLTVSGLFWLKSGSNTFGAGPSNDIVLPEGSAPAVAGAFEYQGDRILLRANKGANIRFKGQPVTTMPVRTDRTGAPDFITLGPRLTMYIIQRGKQCGVRLKDSQSPMRRNFTSLRWYPVDESYRVNAKFVPYNPPKEVAVPTAIGQPEIMKSPGYLEFTLEGKQLRLEPVFEGPDLLLIVFRDLTTGKESYPGGRFLYMPLPKQSAGVLDFNLAENPPCAFTPFATCPLPPKQNRLPIAVKAGEMSYGH